MKNLRNIFALFVLTVAFYSCTSDVTVTDPQSETIEDISSKTGNESNEDDGRGEG